MLIIMRTAIPHEGKMAEIKWSRTFQQFAAFVKFIHLATQDNTELSGELKVSSLLTFVVQ